MIEPLKLNLDLVRTSIWITAIITELVYYEYFQEHEFWNRKSKNEYELNINSNIDKWINNYKFSTNDI